MLNTALKLLKFTATYLVPSLYPAMISALGFMIAAFQTPREDTIAPWLLNAFAWIGFILILATLALTLKKLFGRQPSLSEVLSGLVTVKTLDGYKEEQRLRCLGLEKQISDARHSFDEALKSDLVRSERIFAEIFQSIGTMRDSVSRLQERTETHIRQFDSLSQKLDRTIERLPHSGRRDPREESP